MKTTTDCQRHEFLPPVERHERTRRTPSTGYLLVMVHCWLVMIFFGGLLSVTVILYPNIFHDVPRSLEAAMTFAVARHPRDYFVPLGLACQLSGVASVVFGGRVKSMRYRVLASMFVLLIGEVVFSMLFFWPRNRVMFIEGPAVHSATELRRTAHEFQLGHWCRVALSGVAATLSFIAFLQCYEGRISSR